MSASAAAAKEAHRVLSFEIASYLFYISDRFLPYSPNPTAIASGAVTAAVFSCVMYRCAAPRERRR